MRKPDLVLTVLEFVVERQCVVIILTFTLAIIILEKLVGVKISCELCLVGIMTLNIILEVFYVFAVTLPVIIMVLGAEISWQFVFSKEFLF